ncbi:MAG: serine/threonine-protein phosphatase [Lachnospiraceae bacterium]|nr:serine/threonine-protein phosphatase [Lachnospiraceae bacterium]
MNLTATANTDVGIRKEVNQDSILVKHAQTEREEVMLAVICDGMGGLSKGELASATVIRAFSDWFDWELPKEIEGLSDLRAIGKKWESMLINLNAQILDYGKRQHTNLGTTFSGILMVNNSYVIGHVGDSRVYYMGNEICQLTEDQTVVAKEVREGRMTPEQAKVDRRRNMLLQCVGASRVVIPQMVYGTVEKGVYLLCSDGFRNQNTDEEIRNAFVLDKLVDKERMHVVTEAMINQAKDRNERDNISVILIKAE